MPLCLILISTIVAMADAQTPPNSVAVGIAEGEQHLVTKIEAVYPQLAKQARIEGKVVLNATVSAQGTVEKVTLVSGHPLLAAAATDAVKQWRYSPFLRQGEPVEARVAVEVVFSLPLSPEQRTQADFSKQVSKCEQALAGHRYTEAESICKTVIDLAEKWPQPPGPQAYRDEGDALFYQKKLSQSLDYYRQELALAERETQIFYRDRDQAQAHYDVARACEGSGDLKEAQSHYEKAAAILEQARTQAEASGVSLTKNIHGKALQPLLRDYSALMRQSGDLAAADAALGKANTLATEMAEEQKGVDQYSPQAEQCNKLFRKAEYAEAEAACKTAIELSEKLPKDYWSERMVAYQLEGESLLLRKKAAESLGYYQQALTQAERYMRSSAGHAGALHDVARALAATGDLQQARLHDQRAAAVYAQACEKMRGPLEPFRANCETQWRAVLQEYAGLSRQTGDRAAAEAAEQKANSILENSDSKKPQK
jgi:TonB family protein